ncbi:MAG: hypothetical protein ACYC9M_07630 [Desulfobulbaceae bacterium]
MGQGGHFFNLRKPVTHDAGIALPESFKLLQQHGFYLVAGSAGFPIVFIHKENISKNVFVVDENFACRLEWEVKFGILSPEFLGFQPRRGRSTPGGAQQGK